MRRRNESHQRGKKPENFAFQDALQFTNFVFRMMRAIFGFIGPLVSRLLLIFSITSMSSDAVIEIFNARIKHFYLFLAIQYFCTDAKSSCAPKSLFNANSFFRCPPIKKCRNVLFLISFDYGKDNRVCLLVWERIHCLSYCLKSWFF